MKKSELKVGDILLLRNNDLRKIGENNRIETLTGNLVNNLKYYQDNLLCEDSNGHDRLDIVKVYRLSQERKDEILTKKEKEYIINIIKPFSDKIIEIKKDCCDKYEYLVITYNDSEICSLLFPYFQKGKYYRNMKTGKEYSLKELGIEV